MRVLKVYNIQELEKMAEELKMLHIQNKPKVDYIIVKRSYFDYIRIIGLNNGQRIVSIIERR